MFVTAVLPSPWAFCQPAVQWVSVGGASEYENDNLLSVALAPSGEILCAGAFGYDTSLTPAESVLFRYDSKGRSTTTQATRGESINDVSVASNGDYLLTGTVRDETLLGVGRSFDFYLARYAGDGALLWERTAGTARESERTRLKDGQAGYLTALDAEGNIYVIGESVGPAVYGDKTLPNTVGGPLLCKFAPDGTLRWTQRAEAQRRVAFDTVLPGGSANTMFLDAAGNVVISGQMTKGRATLDTLNVTITATHDYGAFVAKYTPAGRVVWAKPIPFGDVAVDSAGHTYVNGPLNEGQAGFDGATLPVVDPSGYKSFVAKFNPAGELVWLKAAPIGGLQPDRSGNIYSGASKLGPAGELLWARTVPGATLVARGLNNRDELLFTGTLEGTVRLDEVTVRGDSDGYDDFVVGKMDVNGRFQWAVALVSGGLEPDQSGGKVRAIQTLVSDRDGNLILGGGVYCPWSFTRQTYVCDEVSMLGNFPITVQAGGNNDFWLARITDPTPIAVQLKVARTASSLTLSWPVASTTVFLLESSDAVPVPTWTPVRTAPVVEAGQNVVTLEAGSGVRFFRLRQQ